MSSIRSAVNTRVYAYFDRLDGQRLNHWQETLSELAIEYMQGDISADRLKARLDKLANDAYELELDHEQSISKETDSDYDRKEV